MLRSGGLAAMLGTAVLAQTGCTDPARFAEPIAAMKEGTGQVTQVVNGAMDTVVNDADLSTRFCLEREPAATKDAGEQPAPACPAAWQQASDDARVAIARIWFGREAMDALSDYVGALEHVLRSDAGTPLQAAILNVGYSVRALQEATATLPGSGHFERSREMVSGLASFLASIHSDVARGEVLREAVVTADPVVDNLIELIAGDVQVAHALHVARAPTQLATVVQVASAGRTPPYASGNGSLVSPYETDPAHALRELDAAHAALVQAVIDGSSRSFDEMTDAIERFARSADTVFKAYDSYLSLLAQ